MTEELYGYKEIVAKKYKNYLFPELESYISNYLSINEHKIEIYANSNISIDFIIKAIVENLTNTNNKTNITAKAVMEIVSKIIERGINEFK